VSSVGKSGIVIKDLLVRGPPGSGRQLANAGCRFRGACVRWWPLRVIRVAFDIFQHVRYPAYLGPAIGSCEHRDRRDSSPRTGTAKV